MFVYGGMMGVIMIVFGVMSYFYKYVTPDEISASDGVLRTNVETNGDIPLEDKSAVEASEDTKI
jgi:hypothetical protein